MIMLLHVAVKQPRAGLLVWCGSVSLWPASANAPPALQYPGYLGQAIKTFGMWHLE
jgi:hypothetical protein